MLGWSAGLPPICSCNRHVLSSHSVCIKDLHDLEHRLCFLVVFGEVKCSACSTCHANIASSHVGFLLLLNLRHRHNAIIGIIHGSGLVCSTWAGNWGHCLAGSRILLPLLCVFPSLAEVSMYFFHFCADVMCETCASCAPRMDASQQ